jgi:SulP family sulfate permease
MLHSLFLLVFLMVAAPLAAYIPLAALAGVLAVVAWGMAERREFASLLRSSRGDALVVGTTFLLVVFRDLTEGIIFGFALAGLVFIKRMSEASAMRPREEHVDTPRADRVVYHLEGPYFFGAAAQLGAVLDRIAEAPRALVLEMSGVPLIDSSGARGFHTLAARARKRGGQLYLVGLRERLRRQLEAQGLHEPEVRFLADVAAVDAVLAAAQPAAESR